MRKGLLLNVTINTKLRPKSEMLHSHWMKVKLRHRCLCFISNDGIPNVQKGHDVLPLIARHNE